MSANNQRRVGRRAGTWAIRSVAAIALLAAATGTARGQTAQSFEELQARRLLAVGDTAAVEDASGKTFRGRVDALDDGSLTLRLGSVRGETERVFSEAQVSRIRRSGSRSLGKATLIGAGAGLALVAGAAAAYGMNEGGGFCGACLGQWSLAVVPVGAGVGALVGFAIDRANVKTVYTARRTASALSIAPVVGKGTLGAVASIRF